MKYIYRLKNTENGYIWGSFETADAAFDRIAEDPDYSRCDHIIVIRVQVD